LANELELSQTAIVGWFYTLWGEVLAEINQLDEATKLSKMGIDLTEREKNMHYLGSSYLCHLRVLFSRGDYSDAEEIIRKLETTAINHAIAPWIMNQIRAWQARLWLAQNELDDATRWAEELDVDINSELSNVHDFDYVILARVFIAQNRLAESSKLLQRLFIAAEAGGRISKMIEILILQALTVKAENDLDQALRILEKAITLAEPNDFFQIFVDEGPPMANLLYEALQRGIYPEYVRRLLAAFPVTEPEQTPERIQVDDSEWIEPLSEREIEVLQLLAKGLTNQVIADRLVLSIHTVKAHTRSIYSKLAVNNRTQAVDRGRTLGVLPPI
jgi:LuxR family maltose regulon positive regulatory protein